MEDGHDSPSRGPASDAGTAAEPTSATSEKHPAPSNASGLSDAAANKRRRGLGVVTPNACTECRKKRAKCDGKKPCGRCKSQAVECVYEIPVRQSKENLRSEIEQLRKQQRQSESVMSALQGSGQWEEVIQRLRSGQSVEAISDWLGGNLSNSSGDNTLQGFTRPPGPPRTGHKGSGLTLPPLSGITDFTFNTPTTLPGGYGTLSMGHHQHQNQKQEFDHQSPWAFSSHSQTQSTRSNSHPDLMQWTSDSAPTNRVGSWVQDQASTEEARYKGPGQILAPLDAPDMKSPVTTWTAITGDTGLVQHLLALYFCWEYPTFASLSKEHFLKDFLDGRARFCSPILVNALLALGCRFSSQPSTRANPDDPTTSGDHFFSETLRLLARESNHHTLTTIQALGIMSIREASCGRDSESWYYAGQSVRMAIEMGLHWLSGASDSDELAVQAATFWGAFALDHAWSLATGSLPQCSCFPHLPPKPTIIDDIEASLWVPYTDNGKFSLLLSNFSMLISVYSASDCLGAPLQRSCEQPSNVRSVYTCFCELSELVHKSLYVLHSPGNPVTSRDLLSIYTEYINWYDKIPEVLRLGTNFTPAVLFAHMYYHFAILLLFRPLIKLRIIGSSVTPRDVCAQAAEAIQGLCRSYSQLYTLRRTPSFVPYFVLTAAIMQLALGAVHTPTQDTTPGPSSTSSTTKREEGDGSNAHARPSSSSTIGPTSPADTSNTKINSQATEAINQGIADLTEMAPCHNFAEQALRILRYMAKKWNVPVNIPPPQEALSPEDASQLVQPKTHSLNFFAPDVAENDFMCAWGTKPTSVRADNTSSPKTSPKSSGKMPGYEEEVGRGPMAHEAKSIENPLFWPFPMQGRPMVPSGGRMLEEAGFAVL